MILTHKNKFEKYEWSYLARLSVFSHQYENKVKYVPLGGRLMNIMMNAGLANNSGFGAHFELQPIIQRFRFATTILYNKSSDDLKFQLLPNGMIKNQIFIQSKFFNLNLMAFTSGKRNITYVDESNQFMNQELKRNTNYCLQVSKAMRYKVFNIVFSLSGENLNDNVILIDNIRINEQRYSLDVTISIQ